MTTVPHVKYSLFLSYFNEKLHFFRKISEKYSNIKSHEISSSGSQVVPRERTDVQKDRHFEVIIPLVCLKS